MAKEVAILDAEGNPVGELAEALGQGPGRGQPFLTDIAVSVLDNVLYVSASVSSTNAPPMVPQSDNRVPVFPVSPRDLLFSHSSTSLPLLAWLTCSLESCLCSRSRRASISL